jgi:hypothetical protein
MNQVTNDSLRAPLAFKQPLISLVVIIALWAMIRPNPYIIVTLAAIPLIACLVWLRSPGFYEIVGNRSDHRESLATAFILPGAVLAVRALRDFQLLSFAPILIWALAGGLLTTFVMANVDQRTQKPPELIVSRQKPNNRSVFFATLLLFTTFYALGVIGQANGLLDSSAPKTYSSIIISKHFFTGRYSASWYLRLAPWGPRPEAADVSVQRWVYLSVVPGQNACVTLHSGALKFPWYQVEPCN